MTSFSFVSLQRNLTDVSSLELSYRTDGAGGRIHGDKMWVVYPFQSYESLEIDLRRFTLQYSHLFWQPGSFGFGFLFAVQALQISMDTALPELFRSMGAEKYLDYLVVAPSLGVFAEYRTNGSLRYWVSSEWGRVPFGDVEGKLIGFNAGVDYRLTERFFLGFGYRFFDLDLHLYQKRHKLNGSYDIHGYELYAGFDF